MTYKKKTNEQIIIDVDTEIINTKNALKDIINNFEIDDFNIDNESLESVIRGIYEED